MGTCVVQIKGAYMIWSTIVDAPVGVYSTLGGARVHIYRRFGTKGLQAWPDTVKRLKAKGTSMIDDDSLADTVGFNRAGPNETCLTIDELYDAYVLIRPVHGYIRTPQGWQPVEEA